MNNQRKDKKIIRLELEVKVRDKIIAQLIRLLADNKCSVPKNLVDIISDLYDYKMPKGKQKFIYFIKNKLKRKKK